MNNIRFKITTLHKICIYFNNNNYLPVARSASMIVSHNLRAHWLAVKKLSYNNSGNS
jgi:hypothetical protein